MTREKPRYRNASDAPLVVGSVLFGPGAKFESLEWPTNSELEPVNDSAWRVMTYYTRRRHQPHFPEHPTVNGRVYLPAVMHPVGDFDFNLPGQPDGFDIFDTAPVYKCGAGFRVGRQHFAIDEQCCYLGWPRFGLEPVNEAATLVRAYFMLHVKHPDLPPCPWNLYDDSTWLPVLRSLEERKAELPPMAGLPSFTPQAWPGNAINRPPPSPMHGRLKPPWRRDEVR
jgi:hypothetical protein